MPVAGSDEESLDKVNYEAWVVHIIEESGWPVDRDTLHFNWISSTEVVVNQPHPPRLFRLKFAETGELISFKGGIEAESVGGQFTDSDREVLERYRMAPRTTVRGQ